MNYESSDYRARVYGQMYEQLHACETLEDVIRFIEVFVIDEVARTITERKFNKDG